MNIHSKRSLRGRRSGYTLLELVVASASSAIILGGLASSLYISSQAFEVGATAAADEAQANRVLAKVTSDVYHALAFSERTSTAMTFTVPDRDGDTVAETIRYAWSGTPGDPLTYEYNGGGAVDLAENVQSLSFDYQTGLIAGSIIDPGDDPLPLVVMVTGDAAPSTEETDKITQIQAWGYAVNTIEDSASQTDFDDAVVDASAIYVSGEVNASSLGTKVNNYAIGVVSESITVDVNLHLAGSTSYHADDTIRIDDTSHYITSELSTGLVAVTSTNQVLHLNPAAAPPDADTLGSLEYVTADFRPSLVAAETGDALLDSQVAAGRRVMLPWGEVGYLFANLNTTGRELMQRSIDWAAGAEGGGATGVVFEEFTEQKVNSSSITITIPKPVGTSEGDLLVACVAIQDQHDSLLIPPVGWTAVDVGHENGAVTFGVWWKIAGAVEIGDYTFTWLGGDRAYGFVMRFTGHDQANPIDVHAAVSGSSASPATAAVTTTVDDCLVLRLGGFDDDDITEDDPGMSGHTAITMDEAGDEVSAGAAYTYQVGAGDTGSANFALTASEESRTVTVAIAPEP